MIIKAELQSEMNAFYFMSKHCQPDNFCHVHYHFFAPCIIWGTCRKKVYYVLSNKYNDYAGLIFLFCLQMKNHLPNAVEVFSRHGQDVKSCGVIEPGEKFNVPLSEVYTPDGYFLLKPKDSG